MSREASISCLGLGWGLVEAGAPSNFCTCAVSQLAKRFAVSEHVRDRVSTLLVREYAGQERASLGFSEHVRARAGMLVQKQRRPRGILVQTRARHQLCLLLSLCSYTPLADPKPPADPDCGPTANFRPTPILSWIMDSRGREKKHPASTFAEWQHGLL